MTDREKSIIFITDLIESKLRKEREIEYYEEKLKEIEKKILLSQERTECYGNNPRYHTERKGIRV